MYKEASFCSSFLLSIDKINYAGNSGYYLSFYEEFSTIEYKQQQKQIEKKNNLPKFLISLKNERKRTERRENKRVKNGTGEKREKNSSC